MLNIRVCIMDDGWVESATLSTYCMLTRGHFRVSTIPKRDAFCVYLLCRFYRKRSYIYGTNISVLIYFAWMMCDIWLNIKQVYEMKKKIASLIIQPTVHFACVYRM